MKKTRVLLVVACVAVLAVVVSSSVESADPLPPNVRAGDWRPITDDLGIALQRGSGGVMRGTLMTRVGELWVPVALSGRLDLSPPIIPTERR